MTARRTEAEARRMRLTKLAMRAEIEVSHRLISLLRSETEWRVARGAERRLLEAGGPRESLPRRP